MSYFHQWTVIQLFKLHFKKAGLYNIIFWGFSVVKKKMKCGLVVDTKHSWLYGILFMDSFFLFHHVCLYGLA